MLRATTKFSARSPCWLLDPVRAVSCWNLQQSSRSRRLSSQCRSMSLPGRQRIDQRNNAPPVSDSSTTTNPTISRSAEAFKLYQQNRLVQQQEQQQQRQRRSGVPKTMKSLSNKDQTTHLHHHQHPVKPRLIVNFPPGKVTVLCHPGLETVLAQELEALGIPFRPLPKKTNKNKKPGTSITNGRIDLLEPIRMDQFLRAHLYLGSASQILIALAEEFSARALGELERKVAFRVQWNDIVQLPRPSKAKKNDKEASDEDREPTLLCRIKVTCSKSRLMHTGAVRERILNGIHKAVGPDAKLALVTEEEDASGGQANSRTANAGTVNKKNQQDQGLPVLSLVATVRYDKVKLYLDTSQNPLHQRGYRLAVGKAPLREDLAYAQLYSAGWTPQYPLDSALPSDQNDDDSENNMFDAFLDPFCGSGTLAIEAASMRAGLPPGRNLPPPLPGTRWCDPVRWERLVAQSTEMLETVPPNETMISCSDRDKGVVSVVKANAKRAGVQDWIDVQNSVFSKHPLLSGEQEESSSSLLIATNPPYGKRLSSKSSSERLRLFQMFRTKLKGLEERGCRCTASILTRDQSLLQKAGLDFQKDLAFSHGGLFVGSFLVNPSSSLSPVVEAETGPAAESSLGTGQTEE